MVRLRMFGKCRSGTDAWATRFCICRSITVGHDQTGSFLNGAGDGWKAPRQNRDLVSMPAMSPAQFEIMIVIPRYYSQSSQPEFCRQSGLVTRPIGSRAFDFAATWQFPTNLDSRMNSYYPATSLGSSAALCICKMTCCGNDQQTDMVGRAMVQKRMAAQATLASVCS